MTDPNPLADAVLDIADSEQTRIKVAITDIDGVLRGKYILKDKFLSAVKKGFGFCDVVFGWDCADLCYDKVQVTGWHTGYPDAQVRLDLDTFRRVPWDADVPFFLGDFEGPDGQGLSVCPRRLLRKICERAQGLNFNALFGLEFEWFNFRETPQSVADKNHDAQRLTPITPGMFGYSVLRSSLNQPYFMDLMEQLHQFGVPLEGLHTETGPGVFEAAIRYSDALEAADRGVLFKTGVKEIAYRHGIVPTFMARWNTSLPGSSGHIHQSLTDENGDSAFYDKNDVHTMSDTFKHYIAGQIHCFPEILPMLAPTINSYKRLVEGFWAPTTMTWGIDNRTVALRVITGGETPRLETRVSGADVNPYLAVAASLAAGLYGIENKLPLNSEPVKGNGYKAKGAVRLPNSLETAAKRMSQSEIANELFGSEFVEHYTATRLWEVQQYRQAVTDWELKRYFEII